MPSRGRPTARPALQLTSTPRPTGSATDSLRIPDQASACIEVDLLGGLRVRTGQKTMGPRDLGGTKLRRVLLALILHRGSPVPKDRLVSMLWEGTPPDGAKATLESYVCILRKKLQPCQKTRTSLITTVAGCYAIDMSRVDLDLVRHERLISAALRTEVSPTAALPMLERAMSLVEQPLLPEELDCEWLDEARKIHRQNVRKTMIAAANKVAGLSFRSAERWAGLALDDDPLDESAWQALLTNMEASGQHADGLRAYNQCRAVFAAELGCAPGPGLQELYLRLLRGANEDDAELTLLFDAVTQLHAERQLRPRLPVSSPRNGRREATVQARSIEQASRTLELLLLSSGGGRRHPIMTLGA